MNPLARTAKLDLLHQMNDEFKAVTGDGLYMYANCPNTDDDSGAEYFHFQGGHRATGIESALSYMQDRLTAAGGTRHL